ncbi:RNA polymerase sporulation sigma factor SigH, partial [Enterococcus faecalis]
MNLQNNKGKFNKEQFCQLEDEQVIEKVHVGDSDALDYLITKYRNFVR